MGIQKAAYAGPALYFNEIQMGQDKIQMPSGMGGLVRYFDEYKSRIEFKPGHIIVLCIIVIIIMIFLYMYGNRWLGL